MLRDGPKQHKLLFGPAVYNKIIPEDHFLKMLDKHIDWNRADDICRHLYLKITEDQSQTIPGRCLKQKCCSICITGEIGT